MGGLDLSHLPRPKNGSQRQSEGGWEIVNYLDFSLYKRSRCLFSSSFSSDLEGDIIAARGESSASLTTQHGSGAACPSLSTSASCAWRHPSPPGFGNAFFWAWWRFMI
jgi:hypothetical protein